MNRHLIGHSICAVCMTAATAFSADFFRCNFSEMTGVNGEKKVEPFYYNESRGHVSQSGYGISSRAAIFAMDNLQDFQKCAVPPFPKELPAVVYDNLENFPRESGYCTFYFAPFFNQIHTYRKKPADSDHYYYIATFYVHEPNTSINQNAGKSEIAVYMHNNRLSVRFRFKDGTQTVLDAPVKDWVKEQYRNITFSWGPGTQRLYVDRLLADSSAKPGELGTFNALELGGKDYSLSCQGLIDDIVVTSGEPMHVLPPGYDGDPEKFPAIAIPDTAMKNWIVRPNDQNCLSVKYDSAPHFCYQGGREYYVRTRMEHTFPVQENTYLRGDIAIYKQKWDYGCRAEILLEFRNAAGKVIHLQSVDGSNVGGGYSSMQLIELRSFTAIGRDISYFNYWKVPAGATTMRLVVGMAGNPGELILKKWQMRLIDPKCTPWLRQPLQGKQLTYEKSPAVSDETVREILKKRIKPVSKLVRVGDQIEWHVNGEKINAHLLDNPFSGSYSRIVDFRAAGYNIFTSPVSLGKNLYADDYVQLWREDGSFDMRAMERAVVRVLREAPDAYVMLTILVCPTQRWLEENRGELLIHTDGLPKIVRNGAIQERSSAEFPKKAGEVWCPSFHSRKYRQEISVILEKVIREFEKTDASRAVIGIYVCGGDDCQFRAPKTPELSPLALKTYREFLMKKYGTSDNLARAWRRPEITFEQVQLPKQADFMPKGKPVFTTEGSTPESDYREFVAKESANFKSALRQAVKKGAPRLLVGGYDCAPGLGGSIEYGRGRYATKEILEDPYCDFIISLPSYGRERDECTLPNAMGFFNGSTVLHNKLHINELDIRNPEQPPLNWLYRSSHWQAIHNKWSFNQVLRLHAAYGYAWGGIYHAAAINRLTYETPDAIEAWKQVAALTNASHGEPLTNDRIAWINDDRYTDYFCGSPYADEIAYCWQRNFSYALWLSQIRFDAYLSDDLNHPDFKAPKVLLLGNVSALPLKEIAKIRSRFLRDGRMLIWFGTPGLFTGAGDAEISKVLDVEISHPAEIQEKSLVASGKDPLLKGVSGYLYVPVENVRLLHFMNAAFKADSSMRVLGTYQGTDIPGVIVRKASGGMEVFIGQPGALTPQLMRNLAREAGIEPLSDSNDLLIRGGGLICIGASTGDGIRTIRIPAGVKRLECLTGQKILEQTDSFVKVDLNYGECAIFSCTAK